MTTNLISLSSIDLIDETRIHPRANEAHILMAQEAMTLDIMLPTFDQYKTMSSYIFTYDEISLERLVTIGLLNNLLFWIDDLYDRNLEDAFDDMEKVKLFDAIVNMMKNNRGISSNPAIKASQYLLGSLRQLSAKEDWIERLIRNLYRHLNASTYDIDDIIESDRDDVQTYIRHREMDSGMEAEIDLIELAYDFTLPDSIRNHPTLSAARLMCTRIGGLMNDIFSYEKEVIKLGSKYNLLAVIENAHQVPFEEQVERAAEIINDCTATFLSYQDELPTFGNEYDDLVKKYYQGLKDQINGTWHWQLYGTARYKSPTSPFLELRQE